MRGNVFGEAELGTEEAVGVINHFLTKFEFHVLRHVLQATVVGLVRLQENRPCFGRPQLTTQAHLRS